MANKLFSITEMAEMHNISRQTLIYYDKIGLFKPDHIDAKNSYRYYSAHQIPKLREICFEKSLGINLNDIKKHLEERSVDNVIELLNDQKDLVEKEINKLIKTRMYIAQKLDLYQEASSNKYQVEIPQIKEFPEREAIFVPFDEEISKSVLHITYLKAWHIILDSGYLPSLEFGTVIMKKQLETDSLFSKAGIFMCLPNKNIPMKNKIILPAGKYACMYKYGMPYDTEYLFTLLNWIKDNHYEIEGNIVDACLLDNTFYLDVGIKNFAEIQIPIK